MRNGKANRKPARRQVKRLTDEMFQSAAIRLYEDEGTLEIDSSAEFKVSRTKNVRAAGGAYVQAWVWVPVEEAEKEGAERSDW